MVDNNHDMPSLEVEPNTLWEMGFECLACVLENICHLDEVNPHERVLLELAAEMVCTKSRALAKGTWEGYQRCMRQVITFMRETGIWVFPVFNYKHTRGLCLFFESLKVKGLVWATMAHY